MPRTHWILLALGVFLIILAGLNETRLPERAPEVVTSTRSDLGEPDLHMDTAEITQFDAGGVLQYRIRAVAITHYPEATSTLLESPRLTLYNADEAPWQLSARRGRIIGGTDFLSGETSGDPDADASPAAAETVVLEDEVVVRRQRAARGFVELRTSFLTLRPGEEYAHTDRPVIIDTDSGRTTAVGLRADLDRGLLLLNASDDDRIHTTIFPGHL